MNNRTNYTFVGAFVILSIVLLGAFSYWLMKPTDEQKMNTYLIYFTESVSGLNIDSPVKYRGIPVGKVTAMEIDPENPERILIRVSLREKTPVKQDTVAMLMSQGITGLNFIDLSQGSKESSLLLCDETNPVPVIPSVPSFFARFDNSIGTVSNQISKTLYGTEQLLNEDNQRNFSLILERSANVLERFELLLDNNTLYNAKHFVHQSAQLSEKINKLLPQVEQLINHGIKAEDSLSASVHSISISYKSLQSAMDSFKAKNEANHYSMKYAVAQPMEEFGYTMQEMRVLMTHIDALLKKYGDRPSDILFQQQESHKGPGE